MKKTLVTAAFEAEAAMLDKLDEAEGILREAERTRQMILGGRHRLTPERQAEMLALVAAAEAEMRAMLITFGPEIEDWLSRLRDLLGKVRQK